MFSAYCEHCGTEVLLSPRRITWLVNDDGGILVAFRCWNGHPGLWRTGRAATRADAPAPSPALV